MSAWYVCEYLYSQGSAIGVLQKEHKFESSSHISNNTPASRYAEGVECVTRKGELHIWFFSGSSLLETG